MTNTVTIACILNTTDPTAKLGFEAWVDDQRFVDIDHVEKLENILLEIPETDGDHKLKFILKNKKESHTKINAAGNIVSDAVLTISDIKFEDIALGHAFTELAVYTHDFNGTQELADAKFYGEMGCNGTVSIDFSTPVYLWLLENM